MSIEPMSEKSKGLYEKYRPFFGRTIGFGSPGDPSFARRSPARPAPGRSAERDLLTTVIG